MRSCWSGSVYVASIVLVGCLALVLGGGTSAAAAAPATPTAGPLHGPEVAAGLDLPPSGVTREAGRGEVKSR